MVLRSCRARSFAIRRLFSLPVFERGPSLLPPRLRGGPGWGSFRGTTVPVSPHPASLRSATLPEDGEGFPHRSVAARHSYPFTTAPIRPLPTTSPIRHGNQPPEASLGFARIDRMLGELHALSERLRLGGHHQGGGGVEHGDVPIGALAAFEHRLEGGRIGLGIA